MKIEKKQQIRGPSENSGRTKTKWYRKKWLRVTAVCLVTVLVVSEFVIHYTAQQEIQTDFRTRNTSGRTDTGSTERSQ